MITLFSFFYVSVYTISHIQALTVATSPSLFITDCSLWQAYLLYVSLTLVQFNCAGLHCTVPEVRSIYEPLHAKEYAVLSSFNVITCSLWCMPGICIYFFEDKSHWKPWVEGITFKWASRSLFTMHYPFYCKWWWQVSPSPLLPAQFFSLILSQAETMLCSFTYGEEGLCG